MPRFLSYSPNGLVHSVTAYSASFSSPQFIFRTQLSLRDRHLLSPSDPQNTQRHLTSVSRVGLASPSHDSFSEALCSHSIALSDNFDVGKLLLSSYLVASLLFSSFLPGNAIPFSSLLRRSSLLLSNLAHDYNNIHTVRFTPNRP